MNRIGVITATRAEYGVLRNVINNIHKNKELELCLIVTGAHLSVEQGMTIAEIEQDGYPIAERVDILFQSDKPSGISKTMGMAMILFGEVLERQKPDMVIVLGDRYEMLSVCAAGMNARIPIAHISGGETTQGAVDEAVRHCLTKMSYLHFPGCEVYRKRIIQLGESPDRVFNFGDVGVETIQKMQMIGKEQLQESIGFSLDKPFMSVTFHPETLDRQGVEVSMKELLDALHECSFMKFVFTKANADDGGKQINTMIDRFVATHPNCVAYTSLGIQRYVSLLSHSNGVIGNSSSGIIEAPSLHIPTINIGNRQKGRVQAKSIVNVEADRAQISAAIKKVQSKEFMELCKTVENPYGLDNTSEKIVMTINRFLNNQNINLKKVFYDVGFEV